MKLGKYIDISPWRWWVYCWKSRDFVGLFRNKPGVIKWVPGKILPRRWGFYVLGFEFGERG